MNPFNEAYRPLASYASMQDQRHTKHVRLVLFGPPSLPNYTTQFRFTKVTNLTMKTLDT